MKNKLLLVSCALFLFSSAAFAENLLVTKTSGGADEEGTLPYVVANALGGSVIELSVGDETTVTIPETILIDKNLTIDGKGKTISVAEPGVSNYRIFKIGLYEPEDGAELISLTLKNCTLYGGDGTALVDTETTMATWSATILVGKNGTLTGENLIFEKAKNGYAAGIMACGDITLTNCIFKGLSGTSAGGALYTNSGVTGRFTGCTFENNTNTTHGGAVACSGSTNYFTECVFTGNTVTGAKSDGGAIFLQKAGASAEIVNCTFTQNSTTRYGGAISQKNDIATNGVLAIKNSTFTQNKSTAAKGGGGALLTWMGDVTVENCSFEGNAVEGSGGSGGAWYASMTAADINSCKVSNTYFGENTCTAHGGAILAKVPDGVFTNCTFYKNVGGTGGGGALACQAATINVYNSTFVGNELKNESYGTGIHSASNGGFNLYNNIVVGGVSGIADVYTHNSCTLAGSHNIYGTIAEGTPVTTDEFVDNVVYTDQKLFAEDEPVPALNEGTTKNIAIAADGIAAGAGIVVEGVPTVDQRGKSRSATNPAIGSYEEEKATSIERVAVEKLFWPNPAQGNINLPEGVLNITIYDLQGSLVKEVAMPTQSVSVEGLNPGIYLIRITLNGNEHNHRLVIK